MRKEFGFVAIREEAEKLLKCPNIEVKAIALMYTCEVNFKLIYRTKKPLFIKMTLKLGSEVTIEDIYTECDKRLRELMCSKRAYKGNFKLGYLNFKPMF